MSGLNDTDEQQVRAMYDLLSYLDGSDLNWLYEWAHWTPEERPNWTPCEPDIVVDWMIKMMRAKLI